MHRLKLFSAVAALSFCALSAHAASVTINSVSGTWSNTMGDAVTGGTLTGEGTSKIEWGTPCCGNTTGNGSSYVFVGTAPPIIDSARPFILGAFSHNNLTISAAGGSIESSRLTVSVEGSIDGAVFSFSPVIDFDHLETPNAVDPCAAGGEQPCPDLVTLVNGVGQSETVTVDGVELTLTILGFDAGAGAATSFLTAENAENTADLVASMRQVKTETTPEVPLPAASWLLVGGLLWLGSLRSRS